MGISIKLVKYGPNLKNQWDELIRITEPGSVIHKRDFIEYHSDRYEDLSICALNGKTLYAAIPGTRSENTWTSHAGLTYGGILSESKDPEVYIRIIESLKQCLKKMQISQIRFTLPSISFSPTTLPIQLYAFSQTGFAIDEVHLNQVITINSTLSNKKQANARSAERKELSFREGADHLSQVFQIIQDNLWFKYKKSTAHSLNELKILMAKFDESIRVYAVLQENTVVAGAITFDSNKIVNIQYLGSTLEGKRLRAQDYLISKIYKINKDLVKNISFGKSTAGTMAILNTPLYHFKSEFNSNPENIFVLSCNL